MSNQYSIHARTAQLHGKQSEWDMLPTFVPAVGECVVYDRDETHAVPRIKIGDGVTPLETLPFVLDDVFRVIATSKSPDNETYFIDSGRVEIQSQETL